MTDLYNQYNKNEKVRNSEIYKMWHETWSAQMLLEKNSADRFAWQRVASNQQFVLKHEETTA